MGDAIGQKLGRYEIVDRLGRGGMGIVYKAMDTTLRRVVAIKVLIHSEVDETYSERFKREAQMAASLNHPNIMSIFDISTIGNNYYLVIEYIEGESLSEKLRKNKVIPAEESARIIKKVAEALHTAYDLKIVHRDIKPANIMITRQGEPKVTDFGLAKMPSSASISHSGQVVGTPAYMSPEQVEGKKVDHRSDLYSLGITFYEMLSGQQPFKGDNLYNIMMSHVHKEPTPLQNYAHVPKDLARIVMKMIAKKPEDRFQTGKDVADILEKFLNNSVIHIIDKPKPKKRIFRKVFVLLLLVAASLYSFQRFLPNHPFSHKIVDKWQIVKTKTKHLWLQIQDTYATSPDQNNTENTQHEKKREVVFHVDYKLNSGEHGHLKEYNISIISENYQEINKVTDDKVWLLPGRYVYEVQKDGYENFMEPLEIKDSEEKKTLVVTMRPLPRKISLDVKNVSGNNIVKAQQIFINGQLVDNQQVHPGKNKIRVIFDEYLDWEQQIYISPGIENIILEANLVKKEGDFDSIHDREEQNSTDHEDNQHEQNNHSDHEHSDHEHNDDQQNQNNKTEKEDITKGLSNFSLVIDSNLKFPFTFKENDKTILDQCVRSEKNGPSNTFEIFVAPETKSIYVEHGFYFAEIPLTEKQQKIRLTRININKLIEYFKTLDVDEIPGKMFSFYYHQEVEFHKNSAQELQNLILFIKNLEFTEAYQKKYRDSIVNQLQITIKEKK